MRFLGFRFALFFSGERFLVSLGEELLGRIEDEEQLFHRLLTVARVEKVFQRHGAFQSGNDEDLLLFSPSDPVGKLERIRDGGAQKDDVDVLRQHDQDLFPNHAALAVERKMV